MWWNYKSIKGVKLTLTKKMLSWFSLKFVDFFEFNQFCYLSWHSEKEAMSHRDTSYPLRGIWSHGDLIHGISVEAESHKLVMAGWWLQLVYSPQWQCSGPYISWMIVLSYGQFWLHKILAVSRDHFDSHNFQNATSISCALGLWI